MGRPKKNVPGGEVQTSFRIPVDIHRGLRMLALQRGVAVNEIAIEAFSRLLKSEFNEVSAYISEWQKAGRKGHLWQIPSDEATK